MPELRTASIDAFTLTYDNGQRRIYTTDYGKELTFRITHVTFRKESVPVWMACADDAPEYMEGLRDYMEAPDGPDNGYNTPTGLTIRFRDDSPYISEDEWIESLVDATTVAVVAEAIWLYREHTFLAWQTADELDETFYCEMMFCYACALYDKLKAQLHKLS